VVVVVVVVVVDSEAKRAAVSKYLHGAKLAVRMSRTGERVPLQIRACGRSTAGWGAGDCQGRLGGVLHRGIVSLTAAMTDWAHKRAARRSTENERDAGQLARCNGITEELTCSSVQKRRAAEACWRQGSVGYTEQFVGVGDRMRTDGMHRVRWWNAECSSRCRCSTDVRRSRVVVCEGSCRSRATETGPLSPL
jgi:hypothetical protein